MSIASGDIIERQTVSLVEPLSGRGATPAGAIDWGLEPSRTWRACDGVRPRPGAGRRRGERVVFLDRDGTLIVDKPYNSNPAEIELLPGVVEALRLLDESGYRLIVVTNQSGVARGYYDELAIQRMHDRLNEIFGAAGVVILAYYFCPHHREGTVPELAVACPARKPGPGMLLRAAADWPIDLRRSWMIGDQATDARAARAARCRPILVGGGDTARLGATPRTIGLLDAAHYLIALDGSGRSLSAGALRAARLG